VIKNKYAFLSHCSKGKGKAVPLRSIEAHLGDRRYSSCSFLTSALEGGERSTSRPGRAFPPDKEPPVHTVQEAGWAPEPVWMQRLEEKSSASVGDRTPAVQSVVRHCTDWATPSVAVVFKNGRLWFRLLIATRNYRSSTRPYLRSRRWRADEPLRAPSVN
jgi:hypothetical protein